MTTYYVATLASYVLVEAVSETDARELGREVLIELTGRIPYIRTVRPATEDEIELARWHREHLQAEGDAMTFTAIKFDDAREAIQYSEAAGGHAIWVQGAFFVVATREADRLTAAGIVFAYISGREMPDGTYRVPTVPIN